MNETSSGRSPALTLLIGSAVGVGIGFGTCGMAAVFSGTPMVSKIFVPVGLVVFVVSLVAFVIAALWLLVNAVTGWTRRS